MNNDFSQFSQHFTLIELSHSDIADKNGIDNTIPTSLYPNLVKLVVVLELLRYLLHCKIIITSAYRCPELNKLVSSVSNSKHQYCLAADFKPFRTSFDVPYLLDYIKNKGYITYWYKVSPKSHVYHFQI